MAERPMVKAKVQDGVVVLNVTYDDEEMLRPTAGEELRAAMLEKYDDLAKQRPDCVVVLDTDQVGSPLVGALFELYKRIISRRGELRVAGYPPDYMELLNALGVTRLRGFHLSSGGEAGALAELNPSRP